MKNKDQFFDDLARMAGGAVSVMTGFTQQLREEIRVRVDEVAARLDLVPREDFERLEAMLKEARLEQTRLSKRLDALEKKSGVKSQPSAATVKTKKPKKKKS